MFTNKIQKVIRSRHMYKKEIKDISKIKPKEEVDFNELITKDIPLKPDSENPGMTLDEALSYFNLSKKCDWSTKTNCLAFALGLNFSYDKITILGKNGKIDDYIYNCGGFYKAYALNPQNIDNLKQYQKLELDFDILGYLYEEVDINDKIISPDEWKIAFFEESETDVHFFHVFRQTKNGVWYHKIGFNKLPTNLDENMNVINNPISYMKNNSYILLSEYMELQKVYRLRRSK